MSDWLATLTGPRVEPGPTELDEVLERWSRAPGSPFDRAVAVAAGVDRLGHAFAAGYRSALWALTGDEGHAALCVTEEGGGHPRAIRTRLELEDERAVLHGAKHWATLAADARTLLVAASIGEHEGRNRLRVVRVPTDAEGLTWHPMPPTPFTPEILHYRLTLDGVEVPADAVLGGDGYARWIKPFRTIEDLHVVAAAMAHLLGLGRDAGWPAPVIADGISIVAGLAYLAGRPPLEPAVHIALEGALLSMHRWLDRIEEHFGSLDDEVVRRWRRDRPLLGVAGKARAARFDRARQRLGLVWPGAPAVRAQGES